MIQNCKTTGTMIIVVDLPFMGALAIQNWPHGSGMLEQYQKQGQRTHPAKLAAGSLTPYKPC